MNRALTSLSILFLLGSFACSPSRESSSEGAVSLWTTAGDKSVLFERVTSKLSFEPTTDTTAGIKVDTSQTFQTIDGFGYALTGGSALLINQKLSPEQRDRLLRELFLTDSTHIGISYLRISIGASDLDDHVFSYDDQPAGKKDITLSSFSLSEDQKNLIPILKQILALDPAIKIMGSPWSAPAWMKDNGLPKGGSLKLEYYTVYANYLVKYIQGMKNEGIPIDAITLQNEPENPKNMPSMLMTADEQSVFVKKYLGPAFQMAGIATKIIVFDHNCDHPDYPISILNDADAKKFLDGSAFHLYLGEIKVLSDVHQAHPDRNVYFTEQWTWSKGDFGGDLKWHTKNLIIGATRNWSRNVLEWNLAADPNQNPHTDEGGCTECLGALTIGDSISRNVSYYIIAQASKFVRPGSIRVASNMVDGLPNVAFVTPAGKKVLIVLNESDQPKSFSIHFKGKSASASLTAGTVGTFVW